MRKFLAVIFALWSTLAFAQGDGPAHSIPLFQGPGIIGFGVVGPCTAGQTAVWNNNTTDPTCQTLPAVSQNNTWTGDQYFASGRPWCDVIGRGAKGSGLSADAAGNVTAFNACITAVQALGGGTVYVPSSPSHYCLNATITIPQNVRLLGETEEGSILDYCDTGSQTVIVLAGGFATLEEITIFADGFNSSVRPFGPVGNAVNIGSGHVGDCVNCRVQHVTTFGGVYGFWINGGTDAFIQEIHPSSYYVAGLYVANTDSMWGRRLQLDNGGIGLPTFPATFSNWSAGVTVTAGQIMNTTSPTGYLIQVVSCVAPCHTGGTAPTLQNQNVQFVDNNVTWLVVGANNNTSLWFDTNASEIYLSQLDLGALYASVQMSNTLSGQPPAANFVDGASLLGYQYDVYVTAGSGLNLSNVELHGCVISNCSAVQTDLSWVGNLVINNAIANGTALNGFYNKVGYGFRLSNSYINGFTTGVQVDPGVSDWSVTNSTFNTLTNGVSVSSGASDRYVIAHNTYKTVTTPVTDSGTGIVKTVQSNLDSLLTGRAITGTWPAGSTFAFFGNSALSQSAPGNYALLEDTSGASYLNAASGQSIHVRIANGDVWAVGPSGGILTAGGVDEGVGNIYLGNPGTTAGGLWFANATSGTIELAPPTGALGTVTLTLPGATGTVPVEQRTVFSNTPYNMQAQDRLIAQIGTLNAARSVTLVAANSVNVGRRVLIVDESGTATATNTIRLTPSGSDTINGSSTTQAAITSGFGFVELESDGVSKWTAVRVSLSSVLNVGGIVAVANGGTNCSAASGTCLDNITGFASTGLIDRTGAGTYTFTVPGTGVLTAIALGVDTNGGLVTGSTTSIAAGAIHVGAGSGSNTVGVADVALGSLLASGGAGSNPAYCSNPCTLGASGTAGSLAVGNATSGTVTLNTVAGALGSVTASLPANTGTIAETNFAQTWSATQTHSAQLASTAALTIASASGATLDDVNIVAEITTVTGTTNITTAAGFNKVSLYRPTITDASSVTITKASTLYVDNAPLAAGSATITNPWALNTGAGQVFFQTANEQSTILNGIGGTDNPGVFVQRILTSSSSTSTNGMEIDFQNNNSTASKVTRGLTVNLSVTSGNSTAQGNMNGLNVNVEHFGTNSVPIMAGGAMSIINANTGTVTTALGYQLGITNNAGGTNTLSDGLRVNQPAGPSTAVTSVWTNINGVEIQDQNPVAGGGGSNTLTNPPVGLLINSQTATGAYSIKTATGIVALNSATGSAPLNVGSLSNTATTSAICYNTTTGAFSFDGTIGTCTTSDERLKRFLAPLSGSLDKLVRLSESSHFGYYEWRKPGYGEGRKIGLGAQTLERIYPELVATGDDGYKSVAYSQLIVPVIAAIAELKADNDNLRAEIKALKRKAR